MPDALLKPCAAFVGDRLLSAGPLGKVAVAVHRHAGEAADGAVLVFDDATGRVVDLDLRGGEADILARLSEPAAPAAGAGPAEGAPDAPRGRGRPRLGVVAREVTLLPRHWGWLAAQPGGASVALRKLVEEASRRDGGQTRTRGRREAAYRFLSAMAGDRPGFEEASRALFAGDRAGLERHMAGWPADVRDHALRLAPGGDGPVE
ncbi:DUF2239 family protein [Azospirillum agricola]|uniref:DUF2239 family protein n=1 Tax=Azospirillum agricola TaxID=1720247 RepID=UPI000A0F2888|nr:DUF2239 family protein [Azospirillum agricola]SMH53516.1 hypothetical protein SAMN02982994_3347 [Azospirillum lipoferum]